MKKILYILTALLLALSCTACNKASGTSISDTTAVKPETSTQSTSSVVNEPVNELTMAESKGFVMENSTETKQVYIAIYPIDNAGSIFQFDVVSFKIGSDIPETSTYALYFKNQENGEFLFSDTDQNGDVISLTASSIEGNGFMVSGSDFLSELTGIFEETEYRCDIADVTILYFLKNVPEAGLDDYEIYSPVNEIECYMASDWFICCDMFSDGEFKHSFLIARDFSTIIDMTSSQEKVIYGSLDNTLNGTHTYEIYNENGELTNVEEPLVFPVVSNGTTMNAGSTNVVFLAAPYDFTRSLTIVSDNTGVVTVDGTEISAVAPGNATLKVTADYCGIVKEFSLDIEVVEEDASIEIDAYDEFEDSEYVDSKYTTYFDMTSMRATMDVCFEDGFISVDIIWADDAYTEHHWSYIGSGEDYQNVYALTGRYTIDTYTDDGLFSEEIIAENITATLTRGTDGCFYWYDDYEGTDHECIFN